MGIGISRRGKMVSYFFPIAIWLSTFRTAFDGINFGDIILILLTFFSLTVNRRQFDDRIQIVYLFAAFFLQALMTFFAVQYAESIYIGNVLTRNLKFLFYLLCYSIIVKVLTLRHLMKGIDIFVNIAIVVIIYQYIRFYLFGISENVFKLPFLAYDEVYSSFSFNRVFRPSSFFLEPAHLSQFTIPAIAIHMFSKKETTEYNIKMALLSSVAACLSTSGTAIIITGVLWLLFFISVRMKKAQDLLKTVLLVFVFVVLVLLLYNYVSQFSFAISRLDDFDSAVYTGRLNAGDRLIDNMNLFEKIIGVGFGNIPNTMYVNSFNYMLYTTGYIGIFLWGAIFVRYYIKGNRVGRVIVLIFIALCFSSRIFISMYFIYYIALITLINFYTDPQRT